MLPLLFVLSAWAQPVEVAPVVPTVVDVGLQADVLGGIDTWSGEEGLGTELRVGLGGLQQHGTRSLAGGYGGQLQLGTASWLLDHHHAWTALRGAGPIGVEATLSGSIGQGWGEARVAPQWHLASGRSIGQLSLGGVVRTDGQTQPGAALNAWFNHHLHPRWSLGAWVQVRAWTGEYLPHTGAAGLVATWYPRFDTEVRTSLTGSASLGGGQPSRAGLLPGGGALARGDLEVARAIGGPFWLLAAGSWETGGGAADWSRWRVFAGVRAQVGRTRGPPPDDTPKAVRLAITAPEAERVEVVGEFTDWAPLLLERVDDAWILELHLKPGVYEYSYLIDGRSQVPPEAEQTRDDGFGSQNGLLYVGGQGV